MTATGYWMASLSTDENIYLRTNLNNTSFQTASFDTGSQKYPEVVSSNILAKIPIGNFPFSYQKDVITPTDGYESQAKSQVIYYTDNGSHIFSMYLQTKQQGSLRLWITDSYGRPLSVASNEQVNCGGMYFTATIRVDVFG